MTATAMRFAVGAHTLATLRRDLVHVPVTLDEALAGELPVLPPLGRQEGWLVTSLPAGSAQAPGYLHPEAIARVRQRYTRHFADLTLGWGAYEAQLSAATRSGLRRKARKMEQAGGGTLDVRRYRTSDEIAAFLPLARQVSALTYQERLLEGLPHGAIFEDEALRRAAGGAIRGWLLFLDGEPIAYLCCLADGDTLLYSHVGHDPARNALSPGSVLMGEAMRDLQSDRFRRFDFTEGDGQHKRQFATGGVSCVDMLLLRRTNANRAALQALAAFDGAVALGKRLLGRSIVARLRR